MNDNILESFSVIDVFRQEAETQAIMFSKYLLKLEETPEDFTLVENLMRATHSIKGASQIMGLQRVTQFAHMLEDCLVTVQANKYKLTKDDIDCLLLAIDELSSVAELPESSMFDWPGERGSHVLQLTNALRAIGFSRVKSSETRGTSFSADSSMVKIFKQELKQHATTLEEAFALIKIKPNICVAFEGLIRAAHSIKGASGIIGFTELQKLAAELEHYLRSLDREKLSIQDIAFDTLKEITDFFEKITHLSLSEIKEFFERESSQVGLCVETLRYLTPNKKDEQSKIDKKKKSTSTRFFVPTKSIRVSTENLSHILGLSAELLVQARSYLALRQDLVDMKSSSVHVRQGIQDTLSQLLGKDINLILDERVQMLLDKVESLEKKNRGLLDKLEQMVQQTVLVSDQLYNQILKTNMCPFGNGVKSFYRLVRDLGHSLNKNIDLIIEGEETLIDRDILERLEVPVQHILRNACDHGIEGPDERISAGKPVKGTISLSAYHAAGMLMIDIKDDGRGIAFESLREKILNRNLLSADEMESLVDEELLDFLFMPGFSTADEVTEISGRGVGLDIIQDLVDKEGGAIRVKTVEGMHTSFSIQLPITRSVIKTLLVSIENEFFAFPLSRIYRVTHVDIQSIEAIKNGACFDFEGNQVFLVPGYAALGLKKEYNLDDEKKQLHVVIVTDGEHYYGFEIDEIKGEKELVVQQLDSRLGKIPGVSAASLLDDGMPIFILDIEDLIHSADKILSARPSKRRVFYSKRKTMQKKRILLAEDSLTVQEAEKQLLEEQGFHVTTALDGALAWERLQGMDFDLVITDIEMPNVNGLELIEKIRDTNQTEHIPIMVVSHRDTDEAKRLGFARGADAYFSKTQFASNGFMKEVNRLLGL